MAILWGCAFGLQSFAAGMEFPTVTGTPTLETTNVRSNGTAGRIGTGETKTLQHNSYSTGQGVKYYRTYFWLVTAPASTRTVISIDNGASFKVGLRLQNSRAWRLFNEEDGTQIGSDSSAINTGEWYRLELKVDSTTLSSTAVEARLYAASDESTLLWNPSGTADLTADPNRFTISNRNDGSLVFIVTDCTINDSSGSFVNSWPGQGSLVYLRPDGNSGTPQWTRGGADSGANWSQVEETPPNDATDYVESNTNNQIDDYTLTATPSAVQTGDVINWVGVGVRFALSSTTGADPDCVMRITSGGTTDESGNISGAGSTFWAAYQTGAMKFAALANDSNYQQPGGSSAWTKSTLDSATAGIRESVTDTHFIRVTALWVIAEHKPSSGTQYNQSVDGGVTPAGTLLKQGQKVVAGTVTSGGALLKSAQKTFSGTLTSVGDLLKQGQKVLSGTLTSSGALSAIKIALLSIGGTLTSSGTLLAQGQKTLSGTLTSAGTLTKSAVKSFLGTLTSSGDLIKTTAKAFSGTLTSSGVVSGIKVAFMNLSGTLTSSGTLVKQGIKSFSGTLPSTGDLVKSTSKIFSGTLTSAGEISKSTARSLGGILSSSGLLEAFAGIFDFLIRVMISDSQVRSVSVSDQEVRSASTSDQSLYDAEGSDSDG